jgi:histone H3/H4
MTLKGLNKIAEEFLDEIISSAADLASHRGSSVIDVKDVLLPLGNLIKLKLKLI